MDRPELNRPMVLKVSADGSCTVCGGPVPPNSLNRFYCCDGCCVAGQRQFMPELFLPESD